MHMVGIAYSTDGYGQLLAEMLAELPSDHPLPPSCAAAVVPAAAEELRLCTAMRGEFALSSEVMRRSSAQAAVEGSAISRLLTPVLFDVEATLADNAMTFAPACLEEELRRIEADRKDTGWASRRGPGRLQCAGNPVGCILAESVGPAAYSHYALRAQDQGARLKVLATLLWLRQQAGDGRTLESLLAERPPALKSPTREIEVGQDGRSLRIRQFDATRGEYWTIPLPRELWRSR